MLVGDWGRAPSGGVGAPGWGAPARWWAAVAWRAYWDPAEAVKRRFRPCVRRVEMVGVPNRGGGGFPRRGNGGGGDTVQKRWAGGGR